MSKLEKVILILSGVKQEGKTETLRMFANSVNSRYVVSPSSVPTSGDFTIEVDTNIRGSVEKMGITTTKNFADIDSLIKNNCEIIVCETYTEGNSNILKVIALGQSNGYIVLQDKAYRTTLHNATHYSHLNSIKSEHLIDILTKI